jgi:hypothetical protein
MAENQNAELAAEFAPHFGRSLLFAGIATLRLTSFLSRAKTTRHCLVRPDWRRRR